MAQSYKRATVNTTDMGSIGEIFNILNIQFLVLVTMCLDQPLSTVAVPLKIGK